MGKSARARFAAALRRPVLAAVALAACALAAGGASARGPSAGLELGGGVPAAVKAHRLDSGLARLSRAPDTETAADRLGLEVDDGRVRIAARADDAQAAAEAIRRLGGSAVTRYRDLVEAMLPAEAVGELAASDGVRTVAPVARPQPSVVGEGVATTSADNWIAAGNGGAGVKVAVVDVGFGGWEKRRAEGELPANVTTADFCATGGFDDDASDHGTAVAEIVYEVAPAARLYLVCADSVATLGQAKDYAVAKGIHIVNHSVGWRNTARGDGSGGPATPDGIASDARAKGILWVNAAGNEAGRHWSGSFADGDGDSWHEFEFFPEVTWEGNGVAVPQGERLCAYLRWDDWPASAQDYDLYLYPPEPEDAGDYLVRSTNVQTGTQAPVEEVCYTNPNPTQRGGAPDLYLAIRRHSATTTPRFDLFTTHDFVRPFLGGVAVAESSLLEPAASPGAVSVTAVCWAGKGLEPFSSQGPSLDPAAAKPDLAGPDGVSSATKGPFSNCGLDVSADLFGFFGTSAAAPHVAGAAALLKQASPGATPAQLEAELEARTADLGLPGHDTLFGAGLLSLGALPAGQDPPPAAPTSAGAPQISGTARVGQTLSVSTGGWSGAPVALFEYQWRRCDVAGGGCRDIDSALRSTFTVTAADIDSTLRVDVTAVNGGGGTTATSPPTGTVLPAPPQNTLTPAVAGAARIGQTLSAGIGGWSGEAPISYSFDWQRCDAGGAVCTAVGAGGNTYVVGALDAGSRLRAVVVASNRGGSSSAASGQTAVVPVAAPQNLSAPVVTGTARVGQALTAQPGQWRSADTLAYRWWRCVDSTCAYLDGATDSRLVLRAADAGATFRAVVTGTNAGGSTAAHSAATSVVSARLAARTGLAASALRTSRRAIAGRRFAVTMTVVRRSGAALGGSLGCSARVGKRVLPRTQRTLRKGVATCAWRIPPWAAGRRVTGTVRVSAAGNSVVRRFSRVAARR